MQHPLIEQGYIHLNKSEYMRKGALGILNGIYDPIIEFLEDFEQQRTLCDDLVSLKQAVRDWEEGKEEIYVGESGTLFRFLQFISWKYDLGKRFVKTGTLRNREIYNNPDVVNMSARERLKLDDGTSQWETAAVICGSEERVSDPPYKLAHTYRVVDKWEKQGPSLELVYDETLLRQAETYLRLLNGEKVCFEAEQAEDYCFARAFGYMSGEEAREKWPNLKGHESNRIIEMEKALEQLVIDLNDHRVIRAVVMKRTVDKEAYFVTNPLAVNKSGPEFWDFLFASLEGRINI